MKYFLLSATTLMFFQLSMAQKKEADFLITNVSIVPMNTETVLKNKDVAIKDGVIIAITNTKKGNFSAKQTIEGKGKFMMPGLSDAHVHLPEEEKDLEKYLTLNIINGVTKLRSMRGDVKHLEWRKKYNTPNSYFPKLYLSSPPVTRNQDFTAEQASAFVKSVKEGGFDFIKVLSIKRADLFSQLDTYAKENNIKMAGHFPSNPKGIVIDDDVIFNSNLNSIEHLGGLISEKDAFENRIKSMKEKSIYACPTLDWYTVAYGQFNLEEITQKRGMVFIAPEIVKEWVDKTTQYREKAGKEALDKEVVFYAKEIEERLSVINRLNKEGIKLLLSPDSSSRFIAPGFGVMEEIKLYQKAELSNFDILKATTVNFANYFNETKYGTIEIGKNADFILLNENPLEKIETLEKIESVFCNGTLLNKKKLDELTVAIFPKKN